MLLVFSSKAAPNVMMFAEHALLVLKAAGRPYLDALPEQGVIPHDQLAAAITGIERAMSLDSSHQDSDQDEEEESHKHPMQLPVSFKQRAFPLLDMMRRSAEADVDVMWEPAHTEW
ncbi:DUF1840 domain-containing protein [Paenalcaligenes sp. Me131]|uniref:DUF1840 domain-containing protein n=1 Tax=Paenalcaligenes sp. Me131 TaxID=3392636 RepID=UPI003D272105